MQDRRRQALLGLLFGLAVGACITVPAALIAVASAGAGHGDYSLARLLFPYSMLSTRFTGDRNTLLFIALALAQFPLYGIAVGFTAPSRRSRKLVAFALLTAHLATAAACFTGFIRNFS